MSNKQTDYRRLRRLRWTFVLLTSFALKVNADDAVSFVANVAPLLQKNCVTCHDAELAEADYRLDTYQHLMRLPCE